MSRNSENDSEHQEYVMGLLDVKYAPNDAIAAVMMEAMLILHKVWNTADIPTRHPDGSMTWHIVGLDETSPASDVVGNAALGWRRGHQSGIFDAYRTLAKVYPKASAALLLAYQMNKDGSYQL